MNNIDGKVDMNSCNMSVYSGATAHIIIDKSKFIRQDKNFDMSERLIELADSNRSNVITHAKSDAVIFHKSDKGKK